MPHISDGRPPTESRVLCVGVHGVCARRRQPQRQMPKQRSMLLL